MRHVIRFSIGVCLAFAVLTGAVFANPAQAQVTNYATVVNANYLNVRTAASTAAGVIAVVPNGYSYPVIGRTADFAWYYLAMSPTSNVLGWASGSYLNVPNAANIPVMNSPAAAPAYFSMGTVITFNLNVRGTPDPYNGVITTRVTGGQVFTVIGRNNIGTRWWQIQLPGGGSGWVNGRYLTVTNEQFVPITDSTTNPNTPQPVTAYGTVTAYFLNVRTSPNPYLANVIAVISRFQTYTVIGRNADSSWWQISLGNGLTGWVRGDFFSVTNGQNVPVTG
jgi:uncharacterized protein YgiM (DUF1202 family)